MFENKIKVLRQQLTNGYDKTASLDEDLKAIRANVVEVLPNRPTGWQ